MQKWEAILIIFQLLLLITHFKTLIQLFFPYNGDNTYYQFSVKQTSILIMDWIRMTRLPRNMWNTSGKFKLQFAAFFFYFHFFFFLMLISWMTATNTPPEEKEEWVKFISETDFDVFKGQTDLWRSILWLLLNSVSFQCLADKAHREHNTSRALWTGKEVLGEFCNNRLS